MPPGVLQRTFEPTHPVPPPQPAGAELPDWARDAFPDGLLWESGRVWSPRDFVWDMAEEARVNLTASTRAGGGATASAHFSTLLSTALARIEVVTEPLVLDLRSGDGARAVAPWLSLLPRARIVASDPSSVLLASLGGMARGLGAEDRVMAVIAEADRVPIAPGSADLVSGVGCLHEMDDPDLVLAAAARALRPGGHAVFLAPFDGHGVLRLAYERILAEAELRPGEPLEADVAAALRTLAGDIAKRTLPDRADPGFAGLEQKWLFARESLEAAARAYGFRDVAFAPHNDHETLYRDAALLQVRTVSGRDAADLPAWATEVLDGFDRALRPPVKRLLMLEGTILLRR